MLEGPGGKRYNIDGLVSHSRSRDAADRTASGVGAEEGGNFLGWEEGAP